MKIVRAIRQGRIVPQKPSSNKPTFYALWSAADSAPAEHAMHMPAPQQRLPTDAESYNPPAEYLLDADEEKAWDETEKGDRKREFKPAKYESLRKVPAYHEFVQERFERCLDLYLAPRMRKTRLNIDPESLIPKLPSPKELRPFPTSTAIRYSHPGGPRVRCISVDPTGNWVATGAEDGTVRVWELQNGRLAWRCEVGKGAVSAVEWCPDRAVGLIGVAVENRVAILCPTPILPVELAYHSSQVALKAVTGASTAAAPRGDDVNWLRGTDSERKRGILVLIDVPGTPKQVTWHKKGDYFATVATDGASSLQSAAQLPSSAARADLTPLAALSLQQVGPHPPALEAPDAVAVQEDQGLGSEGCLPPIETPLLCRDTALHPAVRPRRPDAHQDAPARSQVAVVGRHPPARRQPHRRLVRQEALLVRPRPEHQAVQDAEVRQLPHLHEGAYTLD
jgi:ribosome biogenesis protein ERB1